MSKRAARKIHKKLRRQCPQAPFVLCAKLSRLVATSAPVSSFVEKLQEFKPEVSISCECCGIPTVTLHTEKGVFSFLPWSGKFN